MQRRDGDRFFYGISFNDEDATDLSGGGQEGAGCHLRLAFDGSDGLGERVVLDSFL